MIEIRMRSFCGRSLAFVVSAVVACGGSGDESGVDPLPPPGTAADSGPTATTSPPVLLTVGAAGGTIVNADGSGVTVPSGALTSDVTVTVTSSPAATPPSTGAAVGTPTTFGPSGLKFAKPVTVVLTFDASKLPTGTDAARIVVFTAPDGTVDYEPLPTRVLDATHVSAETTHFSVLVPVVVSPSTCTALTCAAFGAGVCGEMNDGCGGTLACGVCTDGGPTIDASVDASTDAPAADGCNAVSCAFYGAGACGSLSDGCGSTIDCGTCLVDSGPVDAGSADAAAEACVPVNCAIFGGDLCGLATNECGATVDCKCNAGRVCNGSRCCTPLTCGQISPLEAGVVCGPFSDTCGGTIDCGACPIDAGGQ